jgi:hypothetical protein
MNSTVHDERRMSACMFDLTTWEVYEEDVAFVVM